ncbi:putative Vesicle-associated membrane protein [Naja naja]|nr:putative Vesicle-associated membrane protein [Naja naja]
MGGSGDPVSGSASSSNRRLQQTQNQVDEVLERDQKLSELDDRADALQAGAAQFETNAAKLKRKFWWKNCKAGASGLEGFGVCTGDRQKIKILVPPPKFFHLTCSVAKLFVKDAQIILFGTAVFDNSL